MWNAKAHEAKKVFSNVKHILPVGEGVRDGTQ
jgi:hypothetical protein